uniref:Cilia- and flagella-associated protein 43 n=1 Tax=Salarias fasciatus TaxID=181472 RepID=A0A672JAU7_SALFA
CFIVAPYFDSKLKTITYHLLFPLLISLLLGTAQLDYTSLTLSDGGPYLGCCSSLPDYSITVWNWETAEPICTHPQAGRDVVSLVFNPLNWLQLCTLGTTSITVWNIEKSANVHLPAADGSFAESPTSVSQIVSKNLPHFASETPSSTNSGLKGEQAESMMFVSPMDLSNRVRLTPSAICWTATSKLYVGCTEGFLLLADPDSLSVSILFNSTSKQTCTLNINVFLQVTSMACCPIAHYIAVGTASGNILFIDLNEDQQPRVVYQIYLNHTAVDHLV